MGNGEYFKLNNKIIVPMHAWEISAVLLLLATFIPEHRASFISAAIAHAVHLLQDQCTYGVRFCGYSLLARMNTCFSYKSFCRVGSG